MNADAIIARLMEINRPDAYVCTEVDLNGDILIGMVVREVKYDGFHNRITISGVMDPGDLARLGFPSREYLHGKRKG